MQPLPLAGLSTRAAGVPDRRNSRMSALQAPAALGDRDRVVAMRVFNVSAPKGFQRRSKLEKGMRDWFDNGEATTNKCVLCGPGGIGKSTLVCVCIYVCACILYAYSARITTACSNPVIYPDSYKYSAHMYINTHKTFMYNINT